MNDYDAFIARLKQGTSFLIASHYSPDGDGIGSTIALGLILERMGKRVALYNRDGVPGNLGYLPEAVRVARALDPKASYDMAIMVDCAQRKRISDEFAAMPFRAVACIDHHLLDETEADVSLLDSGAASTGEVILRLARRMSVVVDEPIAQCIYTTLVVDTGFFKYSSTTADCLTLAADLVRAGARPWDVAKHLEESYPVSRMRLLALSLATLDVRLGGGYASMVVTQEMLAASGATMEHSDEFATYPRSIEGVEVSALFREMEDGRTKVSLRSKDLVDVAAISHGFGGGGHERAAGFRIKATIDEAKKRVEDVVSKALA